MTEDEPIYCDYDKLSSSVYRLYEVKSRKVLTQGSLKDCSDWMVLNNSRFPIKYYYIGQKYWRDQYYRTNGEWA